MNQIELSTSVVLYAAPECCLCERARALLERLKSGVQFQFVERDITLDDKLYKAYLERIPVIVINGKEEFELVIDEDEVRERICTAITSGRSGERPCLK